MDEAGHGPAQTAPRVRAWNARAPAAREPQGARVRASPRVRADPVRGQPVAVPAGRRARPRAVERHGAGRAVRDDRAAAGRRHALLPDPRPALLLLVFSAAEIVAAAPERLGTHRHHAARGACAGYVG